MSTLTSAAPEEPLLPREQGEDDAPRVGKLDRVQLVLIILVQLTEPIAATVIFPFVNQFVRETGITGGDERKTGYYAGLIESLFFVTEAMTVYHWGRASDVYGRKPILVIGLLALALSTLGFGLSKTFWSIFLFRGLQGICNGNIGVTKSVMAEISDSTTIVYVFSTIIPVWVAGCTLGPLIGGFLSNPAERWSLFDAPLWWIHPYFLPCLAAASFAFIVWFAISLFLKETNPAILEAKGRRARADAREDPTSSNSRPQDYGTLNGATSCNTGPPPPLSDRVLTKQTIIPITNLGFHAFLQQCFVVLNPLILSTSTEYGGLGMDPYEIGIVLGTWGAVNGLLQLVLSNWLIKALGSKRTYILTFGCQVLSSLCLAAIGILVQNGGVTTRIRVLLIVYFCILTLLSTAYTSVYVFIIDSANERTMGSINGLAQMVASVLRGVAPAVASSLYSVSLEKKILGGTFVYWVLIAIVLLGVYTSFKLPNQLKRA